MRQDWWKEAVVYQIYTRSFFDSNGDGVGDLDGVIAKLDYLASLSVDAIWLSPLHPTPNIDYGYDGTDYFDVAPEQGTLATFDRLIAEARSRGIAVLMDLVMDYTSSAPSVVRSGAVVAKQRLPRLVRVGGLTAGLPAEQLARILLERVGMDVRPVDPALVLALFRA
jgi:hypothetical protein